MARTFNCGVGMVLVTRPEDEGVVMEQLRAGGEQAVRAGRVTVCTEGGKYLFLSTVLQDCPF